MNYLKIWHWYQAQNKQLQFFLTSGCIVLILVLCLYLWLITPRYAVLFTQLDSRDASQIINQLEQDKISYQLRNQGSDILIAHHLVDKTRLKLMNSNIQFSSRVGFELFDKNDFGMTDFSQKINYQRALQGELERTITSFDEIRQARVHLVLPEKHLFLQEENQPRAAVSLQLIQPLTAQQISSIQQLITASIAHMQKNNVIIVDQKGNKLTTNEDDTVSYHLGIKKNMEHYLNEKVLEILERVFSTEEVMVKIDVTLNHDELQRELIKPEQKGILTHEKETQHSVSTKTAKPQTNQDLMREKSYQFGSEKEQFKRASGTIERLTISVVVPQQTNQQQIQQIERLVKSVVGFDTNRGDTISVEALLTPPKPVLSPIPLQKQQTPPSRLFTITVCCLFAGGLLFLLLNQRAKRHKKELMLIELKQWLNQYE